jgi:hypothetical protein
VYHALTGANALAVPIVKNHHHKAATVTIIITAITLSETIRFKLTNKRSLGANNDEKRKFFIIIIPNDMSLR